MIKRILRVLKRDGLSLLLIKVLAKVLRVDISLGAGVQQAKNKAWNVLLQKHNYIVAYGPFAGMRLSEKVWWSKNDRITQTLGCYEEHVLKKLCDFATQGATKFIDIGAADGYFAVGMSFSRIYPEVVAFEIAVEGQKRILENAIANNCAAKLSVFGEANIESIIRETKNAKTATVLIDIEGAEYDFLSDEILKTLSKSNVICELHPWVVEDGYSAQKYLINRAEKVFNIELIKRETYNPNSFSEFYDLSDEERLIAVGEGRGKNMQWLVCTPK